MLLCIVGAALFLVFAYAELPDATASPLVRPFQEQVLKLCLAGAGFCTVSLVWFTWRWWRAYSRPDLYIE
ncbi:MAG: hypothetical protein ACXVZT_00555 [Terriglobales bacterium]